MILTADESLAKRLRSLTTQSRAHPSEYIHNEMGFNYRLTNLQAAVGVAQMECFNRILRRKREIFARYRANIGDTSGLRVHPGGAIDALNCWMVVVVIDPQEYGSDRSEVETRLNESGVQAQPIFHPLHSQNPYRGCPSGPMQIGPDLHEHALCVPSHGGMTDAEVDEVCTLLRGSN